MNTLYKCTSLLACLALLAACGPRGQQPLRPSALRPAPVAPVTSTSIPSPDPTVPNQPGGYTPPQVAAASTGAADLQAIPQLPGAGTGVTKASTVTVSPDIDFDKNAVLGAWNVSAQADTCALNLSLTTWTKGFRASTRKCSNKTLLNIGTWTLAGKQLTLSNANGDTLARLVASGPNRFDGSTEAGAKPISVFR